MAQVSPERLQSIHRDSGIELHACVRDISIDPSLPRFDRFRELPLWQLVACYEHASELLSHNMSSFTIQEIKVVAGAVFRNQDMEDCFAARTGMADKESDPMRDEPGPRGEIAKGGGDAGFTFMGPSSLIVTNRHYSLLTITNRHSSSLTVTTRH